MTDYTAEDVAMHRWCVMASQAGIHVYPLGDSRDHILTSECWCRPFTEDQSGALVHNAMDRREEYERGRKLD